MPQGKNLFFAEKINSYKSVLQDVNARLNTTDQEINVPEKFLELRKYLEEECITSKSCYKSDFTLDRNGVVWLNPICTHLSDARIIARQAYYYVKYSWHKHRHHDSRAETLTTTHEVGSNASYQQLASELICDLKRNLVKFKRQVDKTSHRDVLKAKGIVSYTKSLVEIMRSAGFIDGDHYQREINHLTYFQESLEIISTEIDRDISLYNQATGDARAIILFVFAMITPALIVSKINANETGSEGVPSYIEWIASMYSSGASFLSLNAALLVSLFIFISLKSHYANFWITLDVIKKAVSIVIGDDGDKSWLAKSNLIIFLVFLFGVMALLSGIYSLGAH